jgi:RND family efflux transporter MFP subunit
MSNIGRIILVVIILSAGVGLTKLIMKFAPEAKTEAPVRVLPIVEVLAMAPETVKVAVATQGIVMARTQSAAASEVAGRVVNVDPRFEVGGEFKKGEVILEIESADYKAALANANAKAAEARLAAALEDGRSKNAEREWQKLGKGETPTALVLRAPQLEAAQANMVAADAAVAKAERDLERCSLKAPYDCRVVMKRIDLGSFAGIGTPLADLESLGAYEVRLPVPLEDYAFVKVPGDAGVTEMPEVKFSSVVAGDTLEWMGKIVRTEGGVDRSSRSVFLIAELASPEKRDRYLQPGLFVKASVSGVELKNVYRVPRRAIYGVNQVLIVDEKNMVSLRDLVVVRSEAEYLLVSEGLSAGERICVTSIAGVVENMEVKVVDRDAEVKKEGV